MSNKIKGDDYGSGIGYVIDINNKDSLNYVVNECKKYYVSHYINSEDYADMILSQTQTQIEDLKYRQRKIRLTASNFGKICNKKDKTDPRNILKSILYPGNLNSKEIDYGKSNEPVARKLYESKTNLVVETTGLFIHKLYPWLGCSPDGLVDDMDLGPGLVEIKCVAMKDHRNNQ